MLKDLIKTLEAIEAEGNRLDDLWMEDPENEDLEAAWNKAYQQQCMAFDAVVSYIQKLTGGRIDAKTARCMVSGHRERLKEIAAKE